MEMFGDGGMSALIEVVLINLVLSGDNAIVIGLAAAGLPKEQRNRAILIGIIAATVLRIGFAALATRLMGVPGLLLFGGLLLLWVVWKMWGELRVDRSAELAAADLVLAGGGLPGAPAKTLGQATWQIVVADVSMSLDNVLAVAGAAREHLVILYIGLALSIALMGLAASFIARFIDRYRWIAWAGLAVILYVAATMIWQGAGDLRAYLGR